MFLKNIQLINFKCHENLFLDFSTGEEAKLPVRKTTFLTGENGTGKTALLQAIALVTGGSEALWLAPGLPNDYIKQDKSFCEITATIATAQGEERTLSLRMEQNAAVAKIVADARVTLFPMDAALRHTHRSYLTAGYGSGRRLDTDQRTGFTVSRNPRYAAIHSLFSKDSLLRPLDEWTHDAQYGSGTVDQSIQALKEALHIFLPAEVRFQGLSDNGRFLFGTPDGLLHLEALSNGYQQTVAWVSNLLYHITRTFGDYKNPLSARGLLLIDEIDLHLHPAWQRQLHSFLSKGLPNFQIIATTNSPLTAQQAATDELYTLRREAGSGICLVPSGSDPFSMLHPLLITSVAEPDTVSTPPKEAATKPVASRSTAVRKEAA